MKKLNENEIIIKKSKFYGVSFEVESEEEVHKIFSELKKEFKKYTHLCYAYKIGPKAKYSDDGEPSGTAGRPIFNIIEKKNLDNILICVIRYFGGVKLGAGGLLRAYSGTASVLFDKNKI